MFDAADTTWAEDVVAEAERRLHEVSAALDDLLPVLRGLAGDTDWQSRAAEGFHLAADDLVRDAVRLRAEAGDIGAQVAGSRWRLRSAMSQ